MILVSFLPKAWDEVVQEGAPGVACMCMLSVGKGRGEREDTEKYLITF